MQREGMNGLEEAQTARYWDLHTLLVFLFQSNMFYTTVGHQSMWWLRGWFCKGDVVVCNDRNQQPPDYGEGDVAVYVHSWGWERESWKWEVAGWPATLEASGDGVLLQGEDKCPGRRKPELLDCGTVLGPGDALATAASAVWLLGPLKGVASCSPCPPAAGRPLQHNTQSTEHEPSSLEVQSMTNLQTSLWCPTALDDLPTSPGFLAMPPQLLLVWS
ncbi:hypothetical protein L208DRAFT_1379927 [Tricholoma matsutake]|nr:hypothetical protein L208DRAFT_1379927 [Tricholoma matsutake 945]